MNIHLIKLKVKNLKGTSFEWSLGSVNFLLGSNAVGKTARLDAVLLLLLGYVPKIGKTARATFDLCSGRELVVEGEFDNGWRIRRRWYLDGNSVKTETELPPELETENPVIAAMLDPTTYFSLSERERIAYVAANVPMENKATPDSLLAKIKDAFDLEALQAKYVDQFMSALDGAISEKTQGQDDPAAQAYLDVALEAATELGKEARDYAIRMEKTAQGLLGLRAADAPATDLGALDGRKAEIERKIAQLRAQKEAHIGAAERTKADERRRKELQRIPINLASLEATRGARELAVKRISDEIAAIPAIDRAELEAIQAERRDADAAIAAHKADLRAINGAIESNAQDIDRIALEMVCPYCGASGEGWKTLKRVEIDSALAGLRSKRDTLTDHINKVSEYAAALTIRIGRASDSINRIVVKDRELVVAKQALVDIQRQIESAKAKEAEIAAIPPYDQQAVVAVDLAQTSINVETEEIRAIETLRKDAMTRAGDLKRLAEAETARDAAKAEEKVAKAAAGEIRALKAKMVDDAFVPLLEAANRFFGAALSSPIAYCDGEIGRWVEGTWVSNRALSGKEELLTFAAISAALAARAPCRLMLMDELARLDDKNVEIVAKCLREAVADGRLDGFIGIDLVDRWSKQWSSETEGLTVETIS